jgi:hypothetical protein
MNHFLSKLAIGTIITTCVSAPAFAAPVSWTDWLSSPNDSSASGNLLVGSTLVNVGYSGTSPHSFVQTGTGTNYWTGPAYTQGTIDNAPPTSDIVALNQGGTVTINFSQTVQDPLIGLVSWNNNTVDFGAPIQFDSFGPGFWGNGTPILNSAGTGFFGSGELHGVIRIPGSYDSIMFTHAGEFWHGFTVGASGLASPVPIPAAVWLFGSGLAGLMGMEKIRRKIAAKPA